MLPKNVGAFLGAGWMGLFQLIQMLDPVYAAHKVDGGPQDGQVLQFPVWPIQSDEADDLGKASVDYLKSLPKNQQKAVGKILNKHLPLIMFGFSVYQVAGPRVMFSAQQKVATRNARTMAAQRTSSGYRGVAQDPSPSGPAQETGGGVPGSAGGAGRPGDAVADAFQEPPGS